MGALTGVFISGWLILMKQTLGMLLLMLVSIAIVELGRYMPRDFPASLLFGLLYNTGINSLVFLLGGFRTFRLPDSHYRIKGFERQGRLYRPVGVDFARRLLKFSGAILFDGKRSTLGQLEGRMRFAEKCHVICFVLNVITVAYLAFRDLWELIPGLLLFNLLLNVYPIVTQRYNRARIQLIQRRFPR
jgi:hypothetical protein